MRTIFRARLTSARKRANAVVKLAGFCASLPHSRIVTKHTQRLSVSERAQYQRDGLWP